MPCPFPEPPSQCGKQCNSEGRQAKVETHQKLAKMADDAAKKPRTFRKFTYRGVDLDQLLDMSTDELVDLFPARARRK